MSYLQRKMFANGGVAEANPYYYVSADRKLVPLDSNQLYDVLSTAGIGELTALIQMLNIALQHKNCFVE
jgi:hypothetical protein